MRFFLLWAGSLASKARCDQAVAAYNSGGSSAADITIVFETVGFASSTRVKVRDMIAHKDLGVAVGSWTAASVPPHGVAALRLSLAD